MFYNKKCIKCCFAKNVEERVLNYKPIFLRSKNVLLLVVIFNMKLWLSGCILSMSYQDLTFIIDFSSFHNGLKHFCSLKLVSILRATLWKVVMKCKIVMFFNFLGSFSQNVHFWGCKILSHQVSNIQST